MKNELNEQQAPYNFYTWLYKFIGGATVGLTNATIVTPIANYNNHVINQRKNANKVTVKFSGARAFDGLKAYNISCALRVSIAVPLNHWFILKLKQYCEVSNTQKLLSSIVAGGVAGAAATLPEAIAQTQQLSKVKPSPMAIMRDAYKSNGLFGLSRGMQAIMVRSAGFTAGYLGLMPLLCERMRQEIGDNLIADVFSAVVCGLIVGTITTPPNALRFSMQEKFTEKHTSPTYTQLIKNAGLRNLFTGFMPRTTMSMISMFIINKGNESCELYSTNGFPDFPSLKFK